MNRLIARLDVKSSSLIKGMRFEGLKKIGDPAEAAIKYYEDGIDEIFVVDTVASLYGRNNLGDILEKVARNVFIPITAAGGIRTLEDAEALFACGADKVAVNTAGFKDTELLRKIANKFGAQAVIGSIHAKKVAADWQCLTEQGRERTGTLVLDRIGQLLEMGAGEILVTSVDHDGVQGGYDIPLTKAVERLSPVPITIGGGCGTMQHVAEVMSVGRISGISMGSALHFGNFSIGDLKEFLQQPKSEQGTNLV